MNRKIIIGAAAVGLLLAGVVSAANLTVKVPAQTLAAGDVTVSGADLTAVDYTLDSTGKLLDKVALTFDAPGDSTTAIEGATVAVTIGSNTANGVTDSTGKAVVDVTDVLIEGVSTIKVVVAS